MELNLYYNTSDNRTINKSLTSGLTISGNLREESSIINPIITIKSDALIRENYAYIPETQRYYYIVNKESIRTGIWRLHMKVDPLMSFKRDILALSVVVSKQSAITNGDEYIDDGSLVTDNQLFKTVYKFADGFNDNAQYILITAG